MSTEIKEKILENLLLEHIDRFKNEQLQTISDNTNKQYVYLAFIGKLFLKFGKTNNPKQRFKTHSRNFEIFKPIFLVECSDNTYVEDEFKKYLTNLKIINTFTDNKSNKHTEIIKLPITEDKEKDIEFINKIFDYIVKKAKNNLESIDQISFVTSIECEMCKKSFSNKTNLNVHIKTSKSCSGENRITYDCEYCSKQLVSNYVLKNHILVCPVKLSFDHKILLEEKEMYKNKYNELENRSKEIEIQNENHIKEIEKHYEQLMMNDTISKDNNLHEYIGKEKFYKEQLVKYEDIIKDLHEKLTSLRRNVESW